MPPKAAASVKGGTAPKRVRKGKGVEAAPEATPPSDGAKLEVALGQLEALRVEHAALEQRCGRVLLERDRVTEFFEIARGEVEAAERAGRFKDLDLEGAQDKHLIELKELRQRIKHLVYGHDRAVAVLKAESDAASAAAAAANKRRLAEDYAERAALRALGREQGIKHAEAAAAQRLEASKTAAKLQAELTQAALELEARAGARAAAASAEAELVLRSVVGQVEERRGDHAAALMANHAKAMAALKAEYEGALEARLVATAAAKDTAFAQQQRAEDAEALLAQLRRENEGLAGPLSLATATLAELRAKLVEYDRTTEALVGAKGRLAAASRRLKALEWDHEAQRQELDYLKAAHGALVTQAEAAQLEAWRRALSSAGIRTPPPATPAGTAAAAHTGPCQRGSGGARNSASSGCGGRVSFPGSSRLSTGCSETNQGGWASYGRQPFQGTTVEEVFSETASQRSQCEGAYDDGDSDAATAEHLPELSAAAGLGSPPGQLAAAAMAAASAGNEGTVENISPRRSTGGFGGGEELVAEDTITEYEAEEKEGEHAEDPYAEMYGAPPSARMHVLAKV